MSCNDNISFEEEYLYLIYNIIEAHKNGDSFYENVYRKSYEDICKSLALKYMKSKGFCEMPNFDLIESYEYDYSLAEYISKRELIQYDKEEWISLSEADQKRFIIDPAPRFDVSFRRMMWDDIAEEWTVDPDGDPFIVFSIIDY